MQRINALQRYLERAAASDRVAGSPGFQALLGVVTPEPVTAVRVRWLPADVASHSAAVELQVTLGGGSEEKPVEELVVSAKVPYGAKVRKSAGPPGAPLRLQGLPCGECVELEVRARNGVGESSAMRERLRVPGRRLVPLVSGARVTAVWATYLSLSLYIYIYVCTYMCVYIHIYIYIYI